MNRAIGIDPGTLSFDICGLEGDRLFPERTIPSAELTANPQILVDVLQSAAPVRRVKGFGGATKEAAQGAAVIGVGLAGGVYRELVEVMGLREASGTILDHLFVAGADTLRKKFLKN